MTTGDLNTIILGGAVSPGVVRLSGHDREQGWDVKEAKGSSGASTTYTGEKVAKFTATFFLVQDAANGIDEFAAWNQFQKLIESMLLGAKPFAFDIQHPDLQRQRIYQVSVAKIGGIQHDGKGGATVAVEFLEFKPPKKKGGSPKPKADKNQNAADKIADAMDPLSVAEAKLDALKKVALGP